MNFKKIVVFCFDNWGNCEFFCKKLGCLIRICYFKNQRLFYLGQGVEIKFDSMNSKHSHSLIVTVEVF